MPEEAGGSGGSLADAAAVLRAAGHRAAAVPLAETGWLAGRLLAEAGLSVPAGVLTAASGEVEADGETLRGTLRRVPGPAPRTGSSSWRTASSRSSIRRTRRSPRGERRG